MITLKGTPKGIMILIDEADTAVAAEQLKAKLVESAPFFNEDSLDVFLTSTILTDAEVFSLRSVVADVLKNTQIVFIEHPPKLLPKQHSLLDELKDDEGISKFVRTTVKTGEVLESKYNLIIIGDVEKGAAVRSDANIFVLGSLFGTAHAGAGGNTNSVVVAMRLLAEELKISDTSCTIKTSTFKKFLPRVPEIAYIKDNEINIEQYT